MNDQNLLEQLRLDPGQRDGRGRMHRRYWIAAGVIALDEEARVTLHNRRALELIGRESLNAGTAIEDVQPELKQLVLDVRKKPERIAKVLARAGLAEDAAARAARVVYFAYLGIVMTGGNHASGGASVPGQLRDVVRCVIHDSAQGDEQ